MNQCPLGYGTIEADGGSTLSLFKVRPIILLLLLLFYSHLYLHRKVLLLVKRKTVSVLPIPLLVYFRNAFVHPTKAREELTQQHLETSPLGDPDPHLS